MHPLRIDDSEHKLNVVLVRFRYTSIKASAPGTSLVFMQLRCENLGTKEDATHIPVSATHLPSVLAPHIGLAGASRGKTNYKATSG